jgi:hypothetical protein
MKIIGDVGCLYGELNMQKKSKYVTVTVDRLHHTRQPNANSKKGMATAIKHPSFSISTTNQPSLVHLAVLIERKK